MNSHSRPRRQHRLHPAFFSLSLIGLLWLQTGRLPAADATGAIEGRVFNATTNTALVNARVSLPALGRETATDETGRYRLAGVPAGRVDLRLSYVGMEAQSAAVSVPGNGTVQHDFELRFGRAARSIAGETVKLEAFTVVTDREMSAQAIAMNEQRSAPNIKNVVAIDEFGDRGDENIGEFLRFMPGVSIVDSGLVANELSLRGFPSSNSGVQIDGAEVATARMGDTRSTSLIDVPMSNVSRVEVTKVSTPDTPASGLGGSVNIISKSGFEVRRPQLSFQVYQLFHSRDGLTFDAGPERHAPRTSPRYVQPSFNFTYLHPVTKNLAVTIGGSRTWRNKPMESGKVGDSQETAEWNLVSGVLRTAAWASLSQPFWTLSGAAGVEWRATAKDTLSFNFQARESSSYITRSAFTANFAPGATGGARFVQGAAAGTGSITMGSDAWQDFRSDTRQASARYKHRGDVWRIEAAGAWSQSTTVVKDIGRGHFRSSTATLTNLVLRGDDIPAENGIIPTRYSAVTRTGTAVDVYDGGNYSLDSVNSIENGGWNSMKSSGRIDFARDFPSLLAATVKVGLALDRQERDNNRSTKTWAFRPNGASDVTSRLARNFPVFDDAFNANAPSVYGRPMRWISQKKVYELSLERPNWFVLDEAGAHQDRVVNSRELTEIISAGYVRSDVRLLQRRLWLVGGVRFERTDASGRGALNDINAQYRRNPDGSFVRNAAGQRVLVTNDALALRQLRYVERGAYSKRSYDDLYPSLNATYNVTDNLIFRAGYARNLGRPNITSIVPGTSISDPDAANPTITVNNTGLLPWTANSFDLSLESYQIKDGFGSIGIFRKNISNFFGAVRTRATPELLEQYGLEGDAALSNYDIVTTTNAGDARIDGVEFSYRQALTFLPDWARGLQVFVNATSLRLTGSTTADFSAFDPSRWAGGINFVRSRYFMKVTFTHQPAARRGLVAANATNGIPADTYNYQSSRTRWAVNAQYSLDKHWALYGGITDVTESYQPMTYRYAPGTPEHARGQARQALGAYVTLGVKGTY